jgi:ABC-type multidrug transport system fused ATPase/permease subunit
LAVHTWGSGDEAKMKARSSVFVLMAASMLTVAIPIFGLAIAQWRVNWMTDRLALARTIVMIIDGLPLEVLPEKLMFELLTAADIRSITVNGIHGILRRIELPATGAPPPGENINLNHTSSVGMISEAFRDVVSRVDGDVRVTGAGPLETETFDVVFSKAALRSALLSYSFNFLVLALALIAAVSAVAELFAKLSGFADRSAPS